MNLPEKNAAVDANTDPAALRILFVDDEADIRRLVELALARDRHIRTKCAGSAREALAMLGDGNWAPDCILLDSRMPEMRGETLILALRALPGFASLPIVMLTANATQEDAIRYAGLGAAGLIPKPFDPLALAQTLRSILRR